MIYFFRGLPQHQREVVRPAAFENLVNHHYYCLSVMIYFLRGPPQHQREILRPAAFGSAGSRQSLSTILNYYNYNCSERTGEAEGVMEESPKPKTLAHPDTSRSGRPARASS